MSTWGCTTVPRAESPDLELSHLREENARLEKEVTRLKEASLKKQRSLKEKCEESPRASQISASPQEASPLEEHEVREQPEAPSTDAEPGRPQLRIVKLTPDGGIAEDRKSAASHEDSGWQGDESLDEAGTRPVLRVRGEHEAWVYHRRLDEDEQTAEGVEVGHETE